MLEPYVDLAHYDQASSAKHRSPAAAARHYTETGHRDGLDLNPFFVGDWYAWQHPRAADAATPMHHFIERGCERGYDPSPDVDFPKYCRYVDMAKKRTQAYRRLVQEGAPVVAGVYTDPDDLAAVQRSFLAATAGAEVQRYDPGPSGPRRNLVFLQNRRSPRTAGWLREPNRSYDLWVNYYDPRAVTPRAGDLVSNQVGTKFTAIAHLYESHRELFDGYDYVWLLDDDIELTGRQIEAAFHHARVAGADLAQPSLTHDSYCVWSALHHRPGSRWRQVSTVEIMMPIYSRAMVAELFPHFRRSVSGFGLDLLAGKICAERGGTAVVIDEVVARHGQKIDQAGGAYYKFLRANDINAKAELWHLVQEFDLDLSILEESAFEAPAA